MPALWQLLIAFTRSSLLGFGGGPSTVPLIQNEVVKNFRFMTGSEFADMFALANALPGPVATKLAGYVGYKVAGVLGATVAILGTVVPTAVAMMILYRYLTVLKNNPYIGGAIKAIRPVVIVLLTMLILDLWPKTMTSWIPALIGAVSFGLIYFFKVNQAVVVMSALALGAMFLR